MNNCTVGFARLDITPPLGVKMIGAGPRTVKGVLDPLYVNAVAFGEGEKAAVLLVCDLLGMYGKFAFEWPAKIAEAAGVDPDSVILCCTHTHTGPSPAADKEYFSWLFRRLCDAARMALDDRKPVTDLRWAEGMTKDTAFVRRYLTTDGRVVSHPKFGDPEIVGPVTEPDETVRLVRILRENAPEIALVNCQIHPDSVGGEYISGDYPNALRDNLEKAYPNLRCVYLDGAQGEMVSGSAMTPRVPKSHEKAIRIGTKLAGYVLPLFDKTQPADMCGLRFGQTSLELAATPEGEKGFDDDYPEVRPVLVSTIVFCGMALVGLPGEPFSAVGRAIRENSKYPVTCAMCQANGSHGYFPMEGDYAQPGNSYEPRVSHVQPGSAERLITAANQLLNRI